MARTRNWRVHARLGRRWAASPPPPIRWLSRVVPLFLFGGLLWSGWLYARDGLLGGLNGSGLSRGQLAQAMDAVLHDSQVESIVGGGEKACFERLRARGLIERYPDGEFHPERIMHRSELEAAWAKLVRVLEWHRGVVAVDPIEQSRGQASGALVMTMATQADLEAMRRSTRELFDGRPLLETPRMQLRQLVQAEPGSEESNSQTGSNEPSEPLGVRMREFSSEKPPRAASKKPLEGTVLDALTGKPIADAALSIAGKAVRTDAGGRFPVSLPPSGELTEFLVTADGYRSLTVKRRIEAEKPERVVFRLNPQRALLEGRVLSKTDGKALSGVIVKVGDRRLKTDSAGRFRVQGLKPGYVTVELAGEGFHPARELLFIEEKNPARTLRLDPNLG